MTLLTADSLPDGELAARVCIIGAGAAGLTLACELDGAGFDVLLLETGGLDPDSGLDDLYAGAANEPHPDPTQFRRATFGGTTGLWGGRCLAFDPVDFERREYVPDSGWPIDYDELARHYPRALEYCDAGAFDFSVGGSIERPAPTISGFDGGSLIMADRIERYSLPTNFGRRYRRRIQDSPNVRALLGARCLRLLKAPGEDRIRAALIADRAGRRREVRADVFVLATGGIETPRLLLLSDPGGPGFGNLGDCLGRYYMCHFEATCGRVVPAPGTRVSFQFERTRDGVYCRRQLRFTRAAQERHQLLNMAFRLHFPSYSDASHGSAVMSTIYLAKSVLVPEYRAILQHNEQGPASPNFAHVRNVLLGMPQLMKFAGDYLFRIKFAQRKLPYTLVANADGSYPLEFNSEQVPRASNRIGLLGETDRDGLPRVQVTWHLDEAEVERAFRGFLLLRDEMQRSGACRLEMDERSLHERLARSQPLGGHHIGTARMAATAARGVVDANCAVFGLPNLFVAGSAVFPTSSHANPTLSIVAFAVRMGAHLRARLGAG